MCVTMRNNYSFFRLSLLFFIMISCGNDAGFALEKNIVITSDKDLKGKIWNVPKDVTLVVKCGVIKNGTIVGSNTKIKYSGVVFSEVRILGSWDVPEIKSSMFANLNYVNSLKDVVALANPQVNNRILIQKGVYRVSAQKERDACINICSNTEFVLDGTIQLIPNTFKQCDVLLLKGNNIHVSGKGCVIGDKYTHLGKNGEWGMGVRFEGASNSSLKGVVVRNCWGDCVYVGGNSKNVVIDNCRLLNGRRQGISVTKANGVVIQNCTITDIGGTNPQYAIDLEPNRGDTVTNILIENVTVKNCEGGFLATRSSKTVNNKPVSWIGNIVIRDCYVRIKSKYPIYMRKSESVHIEECKIFSFNYKPAIYTDNVKGVVVKNNTIYLSTDENHNVNKEVKRIVRKKTLAPISIILAKSKVLKNNKIINL